MLHFLYPEHSFLLLSLRAEFQGSNVQEIKEEHVHVLHRVLQWSIPGLFVRPTEMTWEVVPLVGFRIDVQCSVELTSSFAAWNQHTATDRAVKCRSAGECEMQEGENPRCFAGKHHPDMLDDDEVESVGHELVKGLRSRGPE